MLKEENMKLLHTYGILTKSLQNIIIIWLILLSRNHGNDTSQFVLYHLNPHTTNFRTYVPSKRGNQSAIAPVKASNWEDWGKIFLKQIPTSTKLTSLWKNSKVSLNHCDSSLSGAMNCYVKDLHKLINPFSRPPIPTLQKNDLTPRLILLYLEQTQIRLHRCAGCS